MEVRDMRKEFEYIKKSNGLGGEIDAGIGLCINCKHYPECTFCGSPGKPKQFCEEFECMGASCSESGADMAVVRDEPVVPSREPDTIGQDIKLMGLCVNCEYRESCCHTKTNGGIWFCEEYR
ncbi:MAG: hypothetical protein JSV33_04355 [bacterium]|nr:MAG: hypothetical protein JSV33_04355 [bacterium]